MTCHVLLITAHGGLLRQVRQGPWSLWGQISPWNIALGYLLLAARWAVGLLHFALGTVGIFPGAEAAVKKLWLGLWHVSDMCARARSMNASGRLKHVDLQWSRFVHWRYQEGMIV